jgi:ABC-type phosphate transport system substrate-binding protein
MTPTPAMATSPAAPPSRRAALAAAALASLALAPRPAHAQDPPAMPSCTDAVARPRVVYAAGSSALRPFLSVVASLLAQDDDPYTLVYQSQGSCTGVSYMTAPEPEKQRIFDIPAAGDTKANYAVYFDESGAEVSCTLGAEGAPVDVGISDVFADSCDGPARPGDVEDYFGPIQAMTFVVGARSSQFAISAEAAYFAFGVGGGNGRSTPWADPNKFFVRNKSSGTQQMIARAINVPAASWWGVDQGGSGGVLDKLSNLLTESGAEPALGILSADLADRNRGVLRILAFQDWGASCGFLPDSTSEALDKRNVRDGHYPIWGPSHLFARVDSSRLPLSAGAAALLRRFSSPRLEQQVIDVEVANGLIPQCAMQVTRTEEMGPMSSNRREYQCDCYFDFKATGRSDCQPCALPADCPASAPACNYGFCEAS